MGIRVEDGFIIEETVTQDKKTEEEYRAKLESEREELINTVIPNLTEALKKIPLEIKTAEDRVKEIESYLSCDKLYEVIEIKVAEEKVKEIESYLGQDKPYEIVGSKTVVESALVDKVAEGVEEL